MRSSQLLGSSSSTRSCAAASSSSSSSSSSGTRFRGARHAAASSLHRCNAPAGRTLLGTQAPLDLHLSASRRTAASQTRRSAAQDGAPAAPPSQEAPADVPVSMELHDVAPGIVSLRGVCDQRLKFEIEYGLKRGTTDNAYVLKGAGGGPEVLVDVPENPFAPLYVERLASLGALGGVRALVLTHVSPKRMGSLKALLEALLAAERPGGGGGQQQQALDVYLTNPALQLVRESLDSQGEAAAALLSRVVLHVPRPGSTLADASGEPLLRFVRIPNPRWPDLQCVYAPGARALFTGKFFSCHVSPGKVAAGGGAAGAAAGDLTFDGAAGWETYGGDWRYYFDCMLAPVARQAAVALERLNITPAAVEGGGGDASTAPSPLASVLDSLKGALATFGGAPPVAEEEDVDASAESAGGAGAPLLVDVLCPMHGPAVRGAAALPRLLSAYGEWTAAAIAAADQCSVAVLYASAYGNTATLAQALSMGVTRAGVGVETLNLEVASLREVEAVMGRVSGFVIGSPTLGGHMPTQVTTALGSILGMQGAARGLPCGVFGSYGWSGEAVDEMGQKLRDAGFRMAFDALRCKFKPTQAVLDEAQAAGATLGALVKSRRKAEERREASTAKLAAAAGSGPDTAMGKVVGSLCVLTARDGGGAPCGMLASWVSQASFDPPGLTVAVAKDRAVQPGLVTNARFVLNILAEGRERPVVKQLSRAFAPGEDRFAGLDTSTSEATGCVVLDGAAAAYLECTVSSAMDAGDHWVVYATVDSGAVVDEAVNSAVHVRKVGTSY